MLCLILLHLIEHCFPVLAFVDPVPVYWVLVGGKLKRFEFQIAVTHDHLAHVVQTMAGKCRGPLVLIAVSHHLLAEDVQTFELVHHGHSEWLSVGPEVHDPVLRCDGGPLGGSIFSVQAKVLGIIECH